MSDKQSCFGLPIKATADWESKLVRFDLIVDEFQDPIFAKKIREFRAELEEFAIRVSDADDTEVLDRATILANRCASGWCPACRSAIFGLAVCARLDAFWSWAQDTSC